jgi:hypothetical protein
VIVELDVNSLYATAMSTLRISKGKLREMITEQQKLIFDSYSTFIVEVYIESLTTKHWSRFKACNIYVIDNIAYQDLIQYQEAEMKILRGICLNDSSTDNNTVIKSLLDKKAKSSDADEIRVIKNQINFIHGLLLMSRKLKK